MICFFVFFWKKVLYLYSTSTKKKQKKTSPPSCRPKKPQTSLYACKSLTYGALTNFFLAQKFKKKVAIFFLPFLGLGKRTPLSPPLCVCVMVAITYITYLTYLCMENVLGGQKDLGEIAGGSPRKGYWVYFFWFFFFRACHARRRSNCVFPFLPTPTTPPPLPIIAVVFSWGLTREIGQNSTGLVASFFFHLLFAPTPNEVIRKCRASLLNLS